jgi:hypothetical protein
MKSFFSLTDRSIAANKKSHQKWDVIFVERIGVEPTTFPNAFGTL